MRNLGIKRVGEDQNMKKRITPPFPALWAKIGTHISISIEVVTKKENNESLIIIIKYNKYTLFNKKV